MTYEDWITPAELYQWLKIGRTTAWKWRQQGMPHIGSGKGMRYSKVEVEKWLRERANHGERENSPSLSGE